MDSQPRPDNQKDAEEQEELRKILLRFGWADDLLSLSRVESLAGIYCRPLGQRLETRRELVMETLGSLLHEGLFIAGDRDCGGGFHFTPFQSSLADIVAVIRQRYVDTAVEQQKMWDFWFQITDKGHRAHEAAF